MTNFKFLVQVLPNGSGLGSYAYQRCFPPLSQQSLGTTRTPRIFLAPRSLRLPNRQTQFKFQIVTMCFWRTRFFFGGNFLAIMCLALFSCFGTSFSIEIRCFRGSYFPLDVAPNCAFDSPSVCSLYFNLPIDSLSIP